MMYRNFGYPGVFNGLFNEGNMQKANTTAPAINVKESLTKYTSRTCSSRNAQGRL